MHQLAHSGTDGRTYGGDPALVHIPDRHRADVGRSIAATLESEMRMLGALGVGHEPKPMESDDPLCPGCYMIALFDAAVVLAKRTGQDVRELGASMAQLFTQLADRGEYQPTEEMTVVSAAQIVPSLDRLLTAVGDSLIAWQGEEDDVKRAHVIVIAELQYAYTQVMEAAHASR